MSCEGSIRYWIEEIKRGNPAAAEVVWERCLPQLVRLAREKLRGVPGRMADEDDVALSALDSFCRADQRGCSPDLADREGLWRLSFQKVVRKAVDLARQERREIRGGGRIQGESAFDEPTSASGDRGFALAPDDTASPEFAAMMAEQCRCLLGDKPIGFPVSLYANLVAATVYADQPDKRMEALTTADQDFQSLASGSSPASGWSVFMRYCYLEYTGKDDEALQEVDRPRGKVNGAWPATLYALALHRRGRFEDALEVLDGLDKKAVQAYHETRVSTSWAKKRSGSRVPQDGASQGPGERSRRLLCETGGVQPRLNQCHATADCCQGSEVS